jgi:hypothetical protein
MKLDDLLEQKKETIKARWLELIIETYPAESRHFFKKQKNQFSNPVGAASARLVEALYDALLHDGDSDEARTAMDDFVKIRAVQEFTPSEAIACILFLKQAIREAVSADNLDTKALAGVESHVDRFLLEAFDSYMASREKLYQIRADELKRQSFVALQMMNNDFSKRDRGDNHRS